MSRFGLRAGLVLGSALMFTAWGQVGRGANQLGRGTRTIGRGAANIGKGAVRGTGRGFQKVGNALRRVR